MNASIVQNSGFRQFGKNIFSYGLTLIVLAAIVYFIYTYLYGSPTLKTNFILKNIVTANDAVNVPSKHSIQIPPIIAGGEFSINFWLYIGGYKDNTNTRKHLIEIYPDGGTTTNFSTILIALGGATPSLVVRVHTMTSTQYSTVQGQNLGIADCSGSTTPDCTGGGKLTNFHQVTDINLVNQMSDNSLYTQDVVNMFKPMAIDEGSITNPTACDISELAMNKWVNICTVVSGKTLEIYMDGKLVKTCIFTNSYQVDQSGKGIALRYLQATSSSSGIYGFDGYFGGLQVLNTAMNPDDIYKTYMAGPTGSTPVNDPVSFLKYIFTG